MAWFFKKTRFLFNTGKTIEYSHMYAESCIIYIYLHLIDKYSRVSFTTFLASRNMLKKFKPEHSERIILN